MAAYSGVKAASFASTINDFGPFCIGLILMINVVVFGRSIVQNSFLTWGITSMVISRSFLLSDNHATNINQQLRLSGEVRGHIQNNELRQF